MIGTSIVEDLNFSDPISLIQDIRYTRYIRFSEDGLSNDTFQYDFADMKSLRDYKAGITLKAHIS